MILSGKANAANPKAFDRVEWIYLEKLMLKLGFAASWVYIVMKCITSATLPILVNGNPTGPVTPSRGIREGDLLSSYLFLLYAEGLSQMLYNATSIGKLHGVSFDSEVVPTISHLLFAYDSLIFLDANELECLFLKDLLVTYGKASGQSINFSKSVAKCSRG